LEFGLGGGLRANQQGAGCDISPLPYGAREILWQLTPGCAALHPGLLSTRPSGTQSLLRLAQPLTPGYCRFALRGHEGEPKILTDFEM
jgi:hypothetical protein